MQPVFLYLYETLLTAVAAVVHLSAVQCIRMFHYFYVQGFGLAHPCRKDYASVMVCKSCKIIIYYRLYSTGLCYGRFEVVGNYGIWYTSKIMESIFTRLDKIFFLLRWYSS